MDEWVTVVIGTYGDSWWKDLATRAADSALAQYVDVVHVHGTSLCEARNEALDQVDTPFVCMLDADDELEAGYFDAMASHTCDLRAPSVRYVQGRLARQPWMPQVSGHTHQCSAECLPYGNWLVIGTVARMSIIRQVGGFKEWPCYEDWDLWARCWAAGATVEPVPEAVYRAHVRTNSRNRGADHAAKHRVHQDIARANGLPVP